MADTKREVRAIGQTLSGLQAGEQYTFVLKRPKPRVDVENARRAVAAAGRYLSAARSANAELDRARDAANHGAAEGARDCYERARAQLQRENASVAEALSAAEHAAADAKDAPGEVKDGYETAKDAAETAAKHAEQIAKAFDEALRTVGALIAYAESQAAARREEQAQEQQQAQEQEQAQAQAPEQE